MLARESKNREPEGERMTAATHVLARLRLPARYEQLEALLGRDVVRLLTPPEATIELLRRVALSCVSTGEGMLIPSFGGTGTGKTTLIENLSFFAPDRFSATMTHEGPIEFVSLQDASRRFRREQSVTADQVLPINIDHREGAPPSDQELADIKRFLRTGEGPAVLFWLETNELRAEDLAQRYIEITGKAVIDLPVVIEGPDRATWQSIALHTIELCNPVPAAQIPELGINPNDYNPAEYPSIGEFLKALANDFTNLVASHEASTRKPVTLVVAYIGSEALGRGTLPSFTQGADPGLLDSHALLNCTPDSMIGRKWGGKRGILTQTVFRLDARAFWFPPAAVVAMLRRSGPPEVVKILTDAGRARPSPSDINEYLDRTDFGRYMSSSRMASVEARGRPAEDAKNALVAVSNQYGFDLGKDKALNRSLIDALADYCRALGTNVTATKAEEALAFASSLIPDTQIETEHRVICIEFAWRSGDILSTTRRSEAAQYALQKLHNYAVNLGWTSA